MGKHNPPPGNDHSKDFIGGFWRGKNRSTDIESDLAKAKRKYPVTPPKSKKSKNIDPPTDNLNAGLLRKIAKIAGDSPKGKKKK
jgi:hypothetical protein